MRFHSLLLIFLFATACTKQSSPERQQRQPPTPGMVPGRTAGSPGTSEQKSVTATSLNQQANYKPAPEDISPEGFNWVHRDYALILSGSVYEHGFKGVIRPEILQKRRAELETYLESLRKIDRNAHSKWSYENRMAFLMNAYHASVLALIADSGTTPLTNKALEKPETVKLFSQSYSLKEFVEKELRGKIDDPRIFLSLYCFEKWCPEFRNRIINFKNFGSELDVNMTRLVRNPDKVTFDTKKLTLTLPILFKENSGLIQKRSKSIALFIGKFVSDKAQLELLKNPKLKVRFTEPGK